MSSEPGLRFMTRPEECHDVSSTSPPDGAHVSKLVASAIALGLWCASALANDAPFTPVPDVPDYIATFAVKPSAGPSRIDSRTVTHRGGWVRIDSEFNRHRATTFARIGDALTVRIQGDPASVPSYTQLTILRSAKEHRSP